MQLGVRYHTHPQSSTWQTAGSSRPRGPITHLMGSELSLNLCHDCPCNRTLPTMVQHTWLRRPTRYTRGACVHAQSRRNSIYGQEEGCYMTAYREAAAEKCSTVRKQLCCNERLARERVQQDRQGGCLEPPHRKGSMKGTNMAGKEEEEGCYTGCTRDYIAIEPSHGRTQPTSVTPFFLKDTTSTRRGASRTPSVKACIAHSVWCAFRSSDGN
jgi:hypothetical protein